MALKAKEDHWETTEFQVVMVYQVVMDFPV